MDEFTLLCQIPDHLSGVDLQSVIDMCSDVGVEWQGFSVSPEEMSNPDVQDIMILDSLEVPYE